VNAKGLARSVKDDLARHWRHLAAGGTGIAVSVAALVFFLSLGLGIRDTLLGEVFRTERFDVLREGADLNLLAIKLELGKDTLSDTDVTGLESLDGVAAVYPKMRLLVPAVASGGESILGAGMQTELVADGVDPALLADEIGEPFHDPQLDPALAGRPCGEGIPCADGAVCVGASALGPGECREVIPVVVSNHVVELYNGGFRRAYRLPKINPNALTGLGAEVAFGASSLRRTADRVHRHRAELVGTSDAAIPLGITMPLGFVRRLNAELGPPGASDGFHSAVIELEPGADGAAVMEAVEALGLTVRDDGARRAAFLSAAALAGVGLVGATVLAISAVHVMHVFALLVMIRRREIGVMRAVGASRAHIRTLILAESAVVGLVAGVAGLAVAGGLTAAADAALTARLPDFPFKPESFFSFEPRLAAVALGLAAAACVLGALAPALRAASADPATVIAGD
jgi:hypothetical protein